MSDERQYQLPGIPPGQSAEPELTVASSIGDAPAVHKEANAESAKSEAKPSRKRASKPKKSATAGPDQTPKVKAKRSSRTNAVRSPTLPDYVQSAAAVMTATPEQIPQITDEAVAFLAKQDASPSDLLRLQPESLAFVRYHLNFMEKIEASSKLNNAYLLANARPVSPAFQKFADALVKSGRVNSAISERNFVRLDEPDKVAPPTQGAKDFGPKPTYAGAYNPVVVQFGKLELSAGQSEDLQPNDQALEDTKRANRVLGTAQIMMSAQIDDLTPKEAAEMVAADLADLGAIKGEKSRHLALVAIAESSHAQPRYKAEFIRQAPELAHKVEQHKDVGVDLKAPAFENSVEPSQVRLIAAERLVAPSVSGSPAGKVAATAVKRMGFADRLLYTIGGAAQNAGVWLSNRGKGAEAQASETPIPAAKPTVGTKEATPTVAAGDKSGVVPEAVARRFLKIEQDYFFSDRTLAFSDRGNKLATRGAHPDVVRSLIEIASARGWDNITVKGTEAFRRSAWMEAAQNGLVVVGYQPTALDLAELARRPANNSVEQSQAKNKDPQQRQQAEEASHAKESLPAAVQSSVKDVPRAPAMDLDPELAKKAKAFAENKPAFVVKKYPDLVGAYGIVEAAKAFAGEKLPEFAREEFVGMARRHVLQKIISGDAVKGPKIFLAAAKGRETDDLAKPPGQEALDQGKPPRSKEVARDR
jgi:hypothetical protein